MERKFKPGDRVRIKSLGNYYWAKEQGLFVNNTATVRGPRGGHREGLVIVAADEDTWPRPNVWNFEEGDLELLGDAHG